MYTAYIQLSCDITAQVAAPGLGYSPEGRLMGSSRWCWYLVRVCDPLPFWRRKGWWVQGYRRGSYPGETRRRRWVKESTRQNGLELWAGMQNIDNKISTGSYFTTSRLYEAAPSPTHLPWTAACLEGPFPKVAPRFTEDHAHFPLNSAFMASWQVTWESEVTDGSKYDLDLISQGN